MNFRYRPPNRKKRETRLEKLVRKFAAIRKRLLYGLGGMTCLALLFSIAAAFLRESGQAAAETAYARAEEYYAANDFPAARVALAKAVTASPKWTPGLIAQANIALEMYDGETAKSALEKAVRYGANRAEIKHLLGHAYFLTGANSQAEGLLTAVDIPARNRVYALRILGRVYAERGNQQSAQAAFNDALRQAPNNSRVWTEIAWFRLAAADHAAAIAASQRAVAADPNDFRALALRAEMVRLQYGPGAALPWFDRALAINAKDIPLLEEYAVTIGDLGRNRAMLEQARKILALNSTNGRAYYMQAAIAARARNYALAQRILILAGTRINETPGAMLISAISEYELGNFHKSADIFGRLLAIQPGNLRVRRLFARAKQSAGENLDALNIIEPLVAGRDPESYDALLTARAFEAEGDRRRAAAGLDDAARASAASARPLPEPLSLAAAADGANRNPENARFVIPYIRTLLLAGNQSQALVLAKRLQAFNPGVADSHLLVGDVEAAAGDFGAATASYERARAMLFSEGVMLRLVEGYRRLNRFEDANKVLFAFRYHDPYNLSAQRLTAYLLLDQQRWAQALPLLEWLRGRIGYNDSILLANLARAYSGVGRNDDAISNARAAYRIDPANPMIILTYAQTLQKARQQPKAVLELFEKADALIPGNLDVAKGLKAAKAAYKISKKGRV